MIQTKSVMIRNKFAKPCKVCSSKVEIGTGYARLEDNGWFTYCERHCPERKVAKSAPVKRRLTVEGHIYMPYEKDNLPLVRSLPGARWNANGKFWSVSVASADLHRVVEVANRLNLEIDESLLMEANNNSKEASIAADSGLYPFQVTGVDWLCKGEDRLLGDQMGLGKTVQVLMAIPKGMGAIAVVPAAVKYNWGDEAAKWRPGLKLTFLEGREAWKTPEPNELVITNFDILPSWLEPQKIDPKSKKFWEVEVKKAPAGVKEGLKNCVLIVDEAQKVKNYKTKRSKRVKGLSLLCNKVWGLTGTPLHNRPEDLFGMLESLNMQYKVFYGWNNFVKKMGGWTNRWGGVEWGAPSADVPELMGRIMLRRTREEVLPDLPKKTYQTVNVDLDEHLLEECDRLWQEYGDMIEDAFDEEPDKAPLPPFEQFSLLRAKLASSRIDVALEMVEEHEENGVPLVVFSAHKKPIETIGKREGWGCITGETPTHVRQQIVRDFQAGNLKGIASTIKAGGVGLTMTRAWKALFIDLDWVPGENRQAEDRICRIGQTLPCQIVRLVSNHILDQHVNRLLVWKAGIAEAALDKMMPVQKPATPKYSSNDEETETEAEYQARMQEIAELEAQSKESKKHHSIRWTGEIKEDPDLPF